MRQICAKRATGGIKMTQYLNAPEMRQTRHNPAIRINH
jgi:hypothetical protein